MHFRKLKLDRSLPLLKLTQSLSELIRGDALPSRSLHICPWLGCCLSLLLLLQLLDTA